VEVKCERAGVLDGDHYLGRNRGADGFGFAVARPAECAQMFPSPSLGPPLLSPSPSPPPPWGIPPPLGVDMVVVLGGGDADVVWRWLGVVEECVAAIECDEPLLPEEPLLDRAGADVEVVTGDAAAAVVWLELLCAG
jgi:hypothetical protein